MFDSVRLAFGENSYGSVAGRAFPGCPKTRRSLSKSSTGRRPLRVARHAALRAATAECGSASRAACCGDGTGSAAANAGLDEPQPDDVDGQQRGDGGEQAARLQADVERRLGATSDRAYATEPQPAAQLLCEQGRQLLAPGTVRPNLAFVAVAEGNPCQRPPVLWVPGLSILELRRNRQEGAGGTREDPPRIDPLPAVGFEDEGKAGVCVAPRFGRFERQRRMRGGQVVLAQVQKTVASREGEKPLRPPTVEPQERSEQPGEVIDLPVPVRHRRIEPEGDRTPRPGQYDSRRDVEAARACGHR